MRDGKRLVAHQSRDVSPSCRGQAGQKEMAKDGVKTVSWRGFATSAVG